MSVKYYESSSYQQKNVVGLIFYVILMSFAVYFALLVGNGLENPDNLNKLAFYVLPIILGLVVIIVDKLLLKKIDFTIIHDPQKGILSSIVPFFQSPINMAFLTFIFSAPLFFYSVTVKKIAFLAYTRYQVSESAKIFLAGEPAVSGETMWLILLFGIASFLAYSLVKKNKFAYYSILTFFSIPIAGLLTAYHLWRYGGQETNLASVFGFFFFCCITLIFFASIIIVWLLHFLNNILLEMQPALSNDLIRYLCIAFYFVIIVIYIFYLMKKYKR